MIIIVLNVAYIMGMFFFICIFLSEDLNYEKPFNETDPEDIALIKDDEFLTNFEL